MAKNANISPTPITLNCSRLMTNFRSWIGNRRETVACKCTCAEDILHTHLADIAILALALVVLESDQAMAITGRHDAKV